MTLGNMRELGMHHLIASCQRGVVGATSVSALTAGTSIALPAVSLSGAALSAVECGQLWQRDRPRTLGASVRLE